MNKQDEEQKANHLEIEYQGWPTRNIEEPHENDVLCGRGDGPMHHPGNKRYREIIASHKVELVDSKRPVLVASEIVHGIRAQRPPGRFLEHNDKTGYWDDIGDKRARIKTSQAFRDSSMQKSGRKGKPEKDPNAPKQNMNVYILYSHAMREQLKRENPGMTFVQLSKNVSKMYKSLTPEGKATWEA